jgi:hypothetical protein
LSNMTGSDFRFLSFLTFCSDVTATKSTVNRQRALATEADTRFPQAAGWRSHHFGEKTDELIGTGHVVRLHRSLLRRRRRSQR